MNSGKNKKTETKNQMLKFPCLSINQSGHKLYCFSATVKTLWDVLEINRRDPDKDKGYQRTLSASRVTAISNYIKDKSPTK